MLYHTKHLLSFCAWFVLATLAWAEVEPERGEEYFELPGHGHLVLSVPLDWRMQIRQLPNELPPTLRFSQTQGERFEILLTPLWKMPGATADFTADAGLRDLVEDSLGYVAPTAVEKDLRLQPLGGIRGYYFGATDKAPKPGEYKYLLQGAAVIGDLLVTFTALNDGATSPVNQQLLAIIRGAQHRPLRASDKLLKIAQLMIKPQQLSGQCKPLPGEHPVSLQARMHYSMVAKPDYPAPRPQQKQLQSFQCGEHNSTIYYYQYTSRQQLEKAQGFVRGLIWGEGGRSHLHPELIISHGNILIVISSASPGYFERLIP